MLHARAVFLVAILCIAITTVLGAPAAKDNDLLRRATSSVAKASATSPPKGASSAATSATSLPAYLEASLSPACTAKPSGSSGTTKPTAGTTSSKKKSAQPTNAARSFSFSSSRVTLGSRANKAAKTIEELIGQLTSLQRMSEPDLEAFHTKMVDTSKTLGAVFEAGSSDDDRRNVPLVIAGLTNFCWHLTTEKNGGGDDEKTFKQVAKLTHGIAAQNFFLYIASPEASRKKFRKDVKAAIDKLDGWKVIPASSSNYRQQIMTNAATLTTSLYGPKSKQGKASEKLWSGRSC